MKKPTNSIVTLLLIGGGTLLIVLLMWWRTTKQITLHDKQQPMKQTIETDAAPKPIGPYSQAVLFGNLLFISGQVAKDPKTGALITDDITRETRQVMENIKAILTAAGVDFRHVVKTTIYLTDMDFFSSVNQVYGSYFEGTFPARETVAVQALPLGVHVEISMVAMVPTTD